MRRSAILLAAVPGLLLVACGGGDEPGFFVGTWRGETAGIALSLQVSSQVVEGGTTHLQGALSSGRLACLENGPLAGTVVDGLVTLAAHGTGRRSSLTVVDVIGQLSGITINGTLTMSGDNQPDEMCDFAQAPIAFQKWDTP